MSGFSPEWLALREPYDHRARDPSVAAGLGAAFAGQPRITVVDLGCGTGSNLRGTFAVLPAEQHWTLVDYDTRLLATARDTLMSWATGHALDGGDLVIHKAGKRLRVSFRQADLNANLDDVLDHRPELVTAAAFFDLCSPAFIARLAAAVASCGAVFFTTLTYNGQQDWSPRHPADTRLLDAFHDHQRTDKGFGPAAGPAAPAALSYALQSAGYRVAEGDSPWRLGPGDQQLIADLAAGFAAATGETGRVDAAVLASWTAVARVGAVVGHTDTLALPPPSAAAGKP